ncbi:hypothetical protein KP509_39G011100 [Ceratopteris richardii]|uniref:Uncharacterized protein n=1 Tax=Ceratopteris richardii TaxID=49495 RepID=A0A8T2PYP8_CERRI|nr:hypothetical protein KP509_39G011100 [Ceratopteris richardii]
MKKVSSRKGVSKTRITMNGVKKVNDYKLNDYVGLPYHITKEFKGKQGTIQADGQTNIFTKLELYRWMVELYNINHAKRKGVLSFVLKMDECEILNDRKMERVVITLMDRAMENISKDDPLYFSIQSDEYVVAWMFLACSYMKDIQIERDQKLSNNEQDLRRKVSIGGKKARHFPSRQMNNATKKCETMHINTIEYEQWRKLYNAVKDHEATSRNAKEEVCIQ